MVREIPNVLPSAHVRESVKSADISFSWKKAWNDLIILIWITNVLDQARAGPEQKRTLFNDISAESFSY